MPNPTGPRPLNPRLVAERAAQGLPPYVEDAVALARIAAIVIPTPWGTEAGR